MNDLTDFLRNETPCNPEDFQRLRDAADELERLSAENAILIHGIDMALNMTGDDPRSHLKDALAKLQKERVSTEHKQACDRSHDKLKGAYENLADTEQTDVLPETAIENDSTQNGNYADESQRPRSGSVGDRQ